MVTILPDPMEKLVLGTDPHEKYSIVPDPNTFFTNYNNSFVKTNMNMI